MARSRTGLHEAVGAAIQGEQFLFRRKLVEMDDPRAVLVLFQTLTDERLVGADAIVLEHEHHVVPDRSRWLDLAPRRTDPYIVLWGIAHNLDPARLPAKRMVIRFEFPDQRRHRRFWLLVERHAAEVCVQHPGYEEDLVIEAESEAFARWNLGQLPWARAVATGALRYFMLRFSIEPGPRRERISAVYALFGVALIPVSFFAIRLANDFIHPTVFTREGPQMTGEMFAAFCCAWAAMTLLAYVMYRTELAGKRTDLNIRALREALAP